ncbi:hypothetical protein BGX34_005251 [Mortierella sp. NVP85]|nr:hypothetical protein BGX34_005251 [Mortierella sp. NVP85]
MAGVVGATQIQNEHGYELMFRGLTPKLDDKATLNSVSSKSVEVNEEQQEADHAVDRQDESLKVKRQETTQLPSWRTLLCSAI